MGPPTFKIVFAIFGSKIWHHPYGKPIELQWCLRRGRCLHNVIPAQGPEEIATAALQGHALLGIRGQPPAVVVPAIGVDSDRFAASRWCEQEVGTREGANTLRLADRHLLLHLPAHHAGAGVEGEQIALVALDEVLAQADADPRWLAFAFPQLFDEAQLQFAFGAGVDHDFREAAL